MANIDFSEAKFLEVRVPIEFWEEANIDCFPDLKGRVPFRDGDFWAPVIELDNGRIEGWPVGVLVETMYKVRDSGEYWLLNEGRKRIAKLKDRYVPACLAIGENGWGDYLILTIGENGYVQDWQAPALEQSAWEAVDAQVQEKVYNSWSEVNFRAHAAEALASPATVLFGVDWDGAFVSITTVEELQALAPTKYRMLVLEQQTNRGLRRGIWFPKDTHATTTLF